MYNITYNFYETINKIIHDDVPVAEEDYKIF